MILVDTSIWIEHLRRGEGELETALELEQVLMHPYVIAELACGNLRNRGEILALLQKLPKAAVASEAEVLRFIERRSLIDRGIGYLDVQLLVAAALAEAWLWTRDRRLAAAAGDLNLAFRDL